MSEHRTPTLILFSGLAADTTVFSPQKVAFPTLIVPQWPVPSSGDNLEAYCKRIADDLRPHGRCIVGGASFGGIVALHIAQFLDPLCVLLIGSVRSPSELPYYARQARYLRMFIPLIPVTILKLLVLPFMTKHSRRIVSNLTELARQFWCSDPRVFKWSLRQLLEWRSSPAISCPIFQIHGEHDMVIPAGDTSPDRIVARGGHVISLTHPTDVNDFIRMVMTRCEGEPKIARDSTLRAN